MRILNDLLWREYEKAPIPYGEFIDACLICPILVSYISHVSYVSYLSHIFSPIFSRWLREIVSNCIFAVTPGAVHNKFHVALRHESKDRRQRVLRDRGSLLSGQHR